MDGFWKKKKWMIPSPIGRPMADYPTVAISTLRRVEGVIVRENKESDDIMRCHVMRIAGDRVLLIFYDVYERSRMLATDSLSKWFSRVVEWNEEDCSMGCRRTWISVFGIPIHAWSWETFERVISHWGNLILVAEETLEPSSFEKARVLIETKVLDRIEERLELMVESRTFLVRLSKADTFLRGSKYSCPSDSRASSTDSEHMEERSQDEPSEHENPIEVERPFGCDKERVEVGESILSSGRGLQWRGRVLWSLGGRTNYGRALRMFRDKHVRKGNGRPRKTVVPSFSIADISLSDADFQCRQSAILRETNSTVEFGILLGVKTIGQEEAIVQDIARIIAQSQ
ncbi:hypothetical protein V6N13_135812 [Hibiscus sabdariffa]